MQHWQAATAARLRHLVAFAWIATHVAACADATPERATEERPLDAGVNGAIDAAIDPAEGCVAPAGTTSSPQTIADVIELLNAMPKPVTLPCFLSTLAPPLEIHATLSVTSAQPAVGRRSPRIFIFLDGLTLSVVPDGMGSRLLEFGELRADDRSLKAELQFPITETVNQAAPFERVVYDERMTSCAFCHAAEAVAEDIAFTRAFTSKALRPPASAHVGVDALSAEAAACDADAEPDRCAMLQSLFAHGSPLERDFPSSFALFQ